MGELRIALVGLRGSGKSTVGRALAELADLGFADLDEELASRAGPGSTAGELLRRLGEPRFRALELAALEELAARPGGQVLATGGGVVETPAARALLGRSFSCVWLRAPLALLAARIAADPALRPRLVGESLEDELSTLQTRRAPYYRDLSALVLEVAEHDARSLAARILAELRSEP